MSLNVGTINNILESIKKILGIDKENEDFDADIILNINMAFGVLHQLNVGPKNGFSIASGAAKWTDFLEEGPILNMVKTYVGYKVRLAFDPPTVGCVMDALKKNIDELEFRLRLQSDE